jgi:DNA-binding winged helix-turn-helix (wHTH) protein
LIQTVRNIGYRFNPAIIQGNQQPLEKLATHKNNGGRPVAGVAVGE